MEAVAEIKEKKTIEGKFLTFILGGEAYGIEALKVRDIIGIMDITPVQQSTHYMKGVINLRGKVIPVIDLRLKFSLQEEEHTHETCVIVAEVNNTFIGLIVDSVSEVYAIGSGEMENAPSLGQDIDTNFIMGIGNVEDTTIILLDIETLLSSNELEMVEDLAKG